MEIKQIINVLRVCHPTLQTNKISTLLLNCYKNSEEEGVQAAQIGAKIN